MRDDLTAELVCVVSGVFRGATVTRTGQRKMKRGVEIGAEEGVKRGVEIGAEEDEERSED